MKDGQEAMTLDDFKEQLQRHELVDGLGIMITKWLVPPVPAKKKSLCERMCEWLPQVPKF